MLRVGKGGWEGLRVGKEGWIKGREKGMVKGGKRGKN